MDSNIRSWPQICAILWIFAFICIPRLILAEPGNITEWGKLDSGEQVYRIPIENGKVSAEICTYGAQILSLNAPDESGVSTNVVLGHKDLDSAVKGSVLGSVIGRYANRIAGGGFAIDGKRYDLESVNQKTGIQIHGGKTGFQRQNWKIEQQPKQVGFAKENGPDVITLKLISPDGHEGFPGEVTVWVQYRIAEPDGKGRMTTILYKSHGSLEMEFRAITSKPTHINLTNHAYFNLAGKGTLAGHRFYNYMEEVLEFDNRKIPTGKILPSGTAGLPAHQIKDLNPESPDFTPFDHCFLTEVHPAEKLRDIGFLMGGNGMAMGIATSQPGVQIYTANHFKDNPFPKYGAICFETQHYPDAPNQPDFPSTLLRPGELLQETTVFTLRVLF